MNPLPEPNLNTNALIDDFNLRTNHEGDYL
jgi:hypothetical protein